MIGGGNEANSVYYPDENLGGGCAAVLNSRVSPLHWHNRLGHSSLQKLKFSIPFL